MKLLLSLLVSLVSIGKQLVNAQCDSSDYIYSADGKFVIVNCGFDGWSEANNYCFGAFGSTLASDTSSTTSASLRELCNQQTVYSGSNIWCYFGAYDISGATSWSFIDGTPVTSGSYSNWISGEPHANNLNFNCGLFGYRTSSDEWGWADGICEGLSSPISALCSVPDPPFCETSDYTVSTDGNFVLVDCEFDGWEEANDYCFDTFGTTLATDDSSSDSASLQELCDQQTVYSGTNTWCYFGAYDITGATDWSWIDGTAVTSGSYSNWVTGEPHGDNEAYSCGLFGYRTSSAEWGWADGICTGPSSPISALCNYVPPPTLPPTDAITCDFNDYKYSSDGKFILVDCPFDSWEDSNTWCINHFGTTLATDGSSSDSASLQELCNQQTVYSGTNTWCYFGAYDISGATSWSWADGTPVTSGSYSNWVSGEPHGNNAAYSCGLFGYQTSSDEWGWADGICVGPSSPISALCSRTPPTPFPTPNPTPNPSPMPTDNPTTDPTPSPTDDPTSSPTRSPTMDPTFMPTNSPTLIGPCDNNPCDCDTTSSTFEDPFCNICHPATGCSQCQSGYFKLYWNYPCESCNEKLGSECVVCQDFNGCAQCAQGYQLYDYIIDDTHVLKRCKLITSSPITPSPTPPSSCTDGISQCASSNCAGSGDNPNCAAQQSWGCSNCYQGFFMKSHQYPCTACEELDHCEQCADWQGCTQCESGYTPYWDNDCAINICQAI